MQGVQTFHTGPFTFLLFCYFHYVHKAKKTSYHCILDNIYADTDISVIGRYQPINPGSTARYKFRGLVLIYSRSLFPTQQGAAS